MNHAISDCSSSDMPNQHYFNLPEDGPRLLEGGLLQRVEHAQPVLQQVVPRQRAQPNSLQATPPAQERQRSPLRGTLDAAILQLGTERIIADGWSEASAIAASESAPPPTPGLPMPGQARHASLPSYVSWGCQRAASRQPAALRGRTALARRRRHGPARPRRPARPPPRRLPRPADCPARVPLRACATCHAHAHRGDCHHLTH